MPGVARMARPIKRLQAEPDVMAELRRRSRSTTIGVRDRERANIILLRIQGLGVEAVAERLSTTPKRVSLWSTRFGRSGLDGLADQPGRGRKASIAAAKVARVITEATRPPPGRSRWSIRSMARHACVSASSVQRIWSGNDIKPHRVRTFKLSNAPRFAEKFWDVIGLYLNPPDQALVLCCDEKSQCQALERTQLGLPLAPKRPRTMTHDYVRHGTITLFAALEQMTGRLIANRGEPHPCRMATFPQANRSRDATRARPAFDRRQLRDPQTSKGAGVAGETSPLHDAFRVHLVVLAQSRRALLRRPDGRRNPRRQLRLG